MLFLGVILFVLSVGLGVVVVSLSVESVVFVVVVVVAVVVDDVFTTFPLGY